MRLFCLLVLILMTSVWPLAAQSAEPVVVPGPEYDIGFDCPLAQTLSADGNTLWVLMEGCFTGSYSLQAFSVADGAPLPAVDYAERLEPLREGYVDGRTNPLALTPDGAFSIRYADSETYQIHSLTFSQAGEAVAPLVTDETLADLLNSYTEYPETTVFSPDHTVAVALGAAELHVLDLASGEVFFALPIEPEYNAFPSFSPDGHSLYIARLDDFDDMANYASTLSAYSLPDGALLGSYAIPSMLAWVSPDGQAAAVQLGSNDGTTEDLFVVDLASGGITGPFPLYEPPSHLLACENDGRSMSDVDFTRTGRLHLAGLNWLPNSRGFVFTRSYGGEAAGGGRPCAFNHSRLNRFDLDLR